MSSPQGRSDLAIAFAWARISRVVANAPPVREAQRTGMRRKPRPNCEPATVRRHERCVENMSRHSTVLSSPHGALGWRIAGEISGTANVFAGQDIYDSGL
jgi:hypothetical protein